MAHEGLHGDLMESSASQALDRLHPPAVDVTRQEAARADGRSVDQNRTSAADLHLAGLLHAGEPEFLAKEIHQQLIGGPPAPARPALDHRFNSLRHPTPPPPPP